MRDGLQERSLDLDERIDAEQVCLSPSAGLMTCALSAQMYAIHCDFRVPCACRVESIIGCTLLAASQTTLPVPCYVLYTSSCICCRLHVIHVTMHYLLRAVFSPHGLTNTCARQASGSVSRCHSERTVHAAESVEHSIPSAARMPTVPCHLLHCTQASRSRAH